MREGAYDLHCHGHLATYDSRDCGYVPDRDPARPVEQRSDVQEPMQRIFVDMAFFSTGYLWHYPYFHGHDPKFGPPPIKEVFDPAELAPKATRDLYGTPVQLFEFMTKIQAEDRRMQTTSLMEGLNRHKAGLVGHNGFQVELIDYRVHKVVSSSYVGCIDGSTNIIDGQERNQYYIPEANIQAVQALFLAGYTMQITRDQGKGNKIVREANRVTLAQNVSVAPGIRCSTGRCLRTCEFFPSIASVACSKKGHKPAAALVAKAVCHIDNDPVVCELCEKAGILPIFIRGTQGLHGRNLYQPREPIYTGPLAGGGRVVKSLTVENFPEAVDLLLHLESDGRLLTLLCALQASAQSNPFAVGCGRDLPVDFAHLN